MIDDKRIDKEGALFDELGLDQSERVLMMQLPKVSEYLIDLKDELIGLRELKHRKKYARQKVQKRYKYIQICPSTRKHIEIYRNLREAAAAVGVSKGVLSNFFYYKGRKTCGGYDWKRITDWGICTKCGFSGENEGNFPRHGTRNSDGAPRYRAVCKICYNKMYNNKKRVNK